jgi:hypothetical protein
MSVTKTLQFYGMGYASDYNNNPTSAQVTVTLGGQTVYTGSVPTKDTTEWSKLFDDQVVLFNVVVPADLTTSPITITCTDGYAVDCSAVSRNGTENNGVPGAFGRANVNADARQNITLNGEPQQKGPDEELFPAKAEWTYTIPKDSVLAFDLVIDQPAHVWVP